MENRGFKTDATYEELEKLYNDAYRQRGIEASPRYYERCLNLLDIVPGKRILDIACGAGFLLERALAAGLECYGVDISNQAVALARKRAPRCAIEIGNAEDLPWPDEFFDYVTVLGSLEHFVAPERALKEIHRVLQPKGRSNFVLPNSGYLWDRLKIALGQGRLSESTQAIGRVANVSEWKNLLTAGGFAVVRITPIPDAPNGVSLRSVVLGVTNPFIPSSLAYQWAFVCEKG